ncbi:unnamed protein product [Absidia cylindrospora]
MHEDDADMDSCIEYESTPPDQDDDDDSYKGEPTLIIDLGPIDGPSVENLVDELKLHPSPPTLPQNDLENGDGVGVSKEYDFTMYTVPPNIYTTGSFMPVFNSFRKNGISFKFVKDLIYAWLDDGVAPLVFKSKFVVNNMNMENFTVDPFQGSSPLESLFVDFL